MAATKYIDMGLVLIFSFVLMRGATAQSGCQSTIISLAPCLNFVTGNTTTASSSCCSSLSNVVQSRPQCLCPVLNSGSTFGININQTLAMALPAICNVQTPPVARCNAAGAGPATAPILSPQSSPADGSAGPSTTTIPSTPSGDAGTGSKTVPNTSGSASGGSSIKYSIQFMTAFTVFIAAWAADTVMF